MLSSCDSHSPLVRQKMIPLQSIAEAADLTLPSRRQMLHMGGLGFGGLVLNYLLGTDAKGAATKTDFSLRASQSDFASPVKAVIMMMQNGGPSQMDLFDPKPALSRLDGSQHTFRVETFQPGSETNTLLASPFKFRRYGESGMDFSNMVPHMAGLADQWCMVRSMHTGHNNHTEALIMFMTGQIFQSRPTFGAWITYALGTENQNLPAYVVLRDPSGYNTSGTLTWTSGWLPALFQGTEFSTAGTPVLNLRPQREMPPGVRADSLKFLAELNRLHQRKYPSEGDLETRIQNYELAARMQLEADKVLDISDETAETQKLYGLDQERTRPYGLRCLMARKLVEAGVRFVQIHPKPFQPWDSHQNTQTELIDICGDTDLPTAGLIKDLRQRGLLDSTVVIWSGEFGRLPISQNATGRDHNRNAFTTLLAGGGFRSGLIHGETDDIGYKSVTDRVSVADLHATILHQLGIDHGQLTFRHSGRDETPTDPSLTGAHVVSELLA